MPGGSGTSTDFSPNTTPNCYPPRMTRAQALARIAAGTLNENCVVVITDGPTIGTTGNTSATEIELQPESPTDLGMAALVHTTFDTTAWVGIYDINVGTGTLIRLEDNKSNIVDDNTGIVIATMFPWHAGNNVHSNKIDSANVATGGGVNAMTLTGWGPAADSLNGINGNDISGGDGITTIDLTGLVNANAIFTGNTIKSGVVNILGMPAQPGGGTISGFASTTVTDNFVVTINATGTAQVIIDGCTMSGRDSTTVAGTPDMLVNPSAGATTISQGSRFVGAGLNLTAYSFGGSGDITVRRSNFLGNITPTTFTKAGSSAMSVLNTELEGSALSVDGSVGGVLWARAKFEGITLTRNAAATSPMTISDSDLGSTTVTQAAGALGGTGLQITGAVVKFGSTVQNGAAGVFLNGGFYAGAAVSSITTAARHLQLRNCNVNGGTVQTQRSNGASATTDILRDSTVDGGLVVFAGAVDPAINQTFARLIVTGTAQFVDPASATHIQDLVVTAGGVFGSQAGSGPHVNIRVGGGQLNTAAFAHTNVTYEITGTQTLTVANTNRLRNVGFTNTV